MKDILDSINNVLMYEKSNNEGKEMVTSSPANVKPLQYFLFPMISSQNLWLLTNETYTQNAKNN